MAMGQWTSTVIAMAEGEQVEEWAAAAVAGAEPVVARGNTTAQDGPVATPTRELTLYSKAIIDAVFNREQGCYLIFDYLTM